MSSPHRHVAHVPTQRMQHPHGPTARGCGRKSIFGHDWRELSGGDQPVLVGEEGEEHEATEEARVQ